MRRSGAIGRRQGPPLRGLAAILTVALAAVGGAAAPAPPVAPVKLYHKADRRDTPAEIQRQALSYDLLFALTPEQAAAIRSRKPGLVVLFYEQPFGRWRGADDIRTVDAQEAWFVHDARGSRLQNQNRLWLLDIGHPGYRAYEVARLVRMAALPGYDGLYLDVAHPAWLERRGWQDAAGAPAEVPQAVADRWPQDLLTFFEALRARLPAGKRLVLNALPTRRERARAWQAWEERALRLADGVQMDGFCYNRERPWEEADWAYQVERITQVAEAGKLVLAKAPVRAGGEALDRLERFCFASYLLVADGRNVYYFGAFALNGAPLRTPERFRPALGLPAGPARRVGAVYVREFQHGRVVVNPSGRPATVGLETPLRAVDGQSLTTLDLEGYSGAILLKP